jgi:replicative DNA helicase
MSIHEDMKMLETRIPPQCLDIERVILSSFLIDHDIFIKYSSQIKPEYFYNAFYEKLIGFMIESGITNPSILGDKFPDKMIEIADCIDNCASSQSLEHMIVILKDRWTRRQHIAFMAEATEKLFTDFDTPAIKQAENTISSLNTFEQQINRPESLIEAFPGLLNQLEGICKGEGIKTGLRDVDCFLGALLPGEYTILAARPSMGKTMYSLQIARKTALENCPVLFFSLETLKNMICGRVVFSAAELNFEQALHGNMREVSRLRDNQVVTDTLNLPIYIDDNPAVSITHIQSVTEYYVKKYNVGLLIIDHLGLVKTKSGRSRNEEVSEISNGIKNIGLKFKIPTIALCQLSRACTMRNPPIPQLSDLRDSGSIEQDADKVIFIYREEYYKRDSDKKGIAEIIVAKNKNGKTGYNEVVFDKEHMLFKNLEKNQEPTIWPDDQRKDYYQ